MASKAASKSLNSKSNMKEPSIEDLTAQIEALKSDLADLTSTLGSYGKAKAADASDTLRQKSAEYAEAGKERASQAQTKAEDFIKSQPATALGIAAGVGFLFGMLTKRR